ncbi:MAG: dihydroorotate dehydrogenase electron transfer subunit [bacterium]|nr:MAG: dihydroorotate dehydrogenase electron transfer subunit [bacterium]
MCGEKLRRPGFQEAGITSHEPLAEDLFRLVFATDGWSGTEPDAGQFLMLHVSGGSDPLLARPFGISAFRREGRGAVLEIIYRVVGRGTRLMAAWKAGQRLRFLGPLGRGFALPPEGSRSLLVAGGIGLPPLLALAGRMEAMGRAGELTLLYGESRRERLADLQSGIFPDIEVRTCTEDGSCGTRGMVTDLLKAAGSGEDRHLYVCGPNAMMGAVLGLSGGRGLSAQYSLEARMACGFGVCSGCAVKVTSGGYVRACREGPVFDEAELTMESFARI